MSLGVSLEWLLGDYWSGYLVTTGVATGVATGVVTWVVTGVVSGRVDWEGYLVLMGEICFFNNPRLDNNPIST